MDECGPAAQGLHLSPAQVEVGGPVYVDQSPVYVQSAPVNVAPAQVYVAPPEVNQAPPPPPSGYYGDLPPPEAPAPQAPPRHHGYAQEPGERG